MVNEAWYSMIHAKQNLWERYKRRWIIGGICVGLIAMGSAITWNILAWQDYEQKPTTWKATLRTQTDEVLALPAKTAADRDRKHRSLVALHTTISGGKDICQRYQILHWQRFIPRVKEYIDRCTETIGELTQFARDIIKVTDYIDAERNMTASLAKGVATKLDEAAWRLQPQTWQGIEKELSELRSPHAFREVHQLAEAKARSVREAWQALVVASEAKDRAKYEAASGKLAAIYDTFGELASLSENTFLPLATALEKSYQQVFK